MVSLNMADSLVQVVLERWTVTELTVLFTIFVGLVGILVGLHFYQKQWIAKYGPHANWLRVEKWLENQNLQIPTMDETIEVMNKRLKNLTSEDWKDLRLSGFLSGTQPPEFEVTSIVKEDSHSIEFQCTMEWPMCIPGMEVELTEAESGKRVTCQLLVEWMLAQVQVTFSNSCSGLVVSFRHVASPLMGLSCSVDQQNMVEDHEKLASSVAHAFHEVFAALSLQGEAMINESCSTTLPTVLVSAPVEEEEVMSHDVTVKEISDEVITIECRKPGEAAGDSPCTNGDSPPPSVQDEGFSEDLSEQDLQQPQEKVEESKKEEIKQVEPQPLTNETYQFSNDSTPNHHEDVVPPISPTWKRSSSYEQLQQIVPEEVGGDRGRRALTLSMAGSETESIYGADDRIPSTLVFEVADSIKVRHIVALNLPHASKLRRHFSNAKKLHIYNDHCFVATHVRQKCECAVCQAKISGLFGKQAYICRDCELVVHKQCHCKVEGLCTNSQVHTMNLIYPERTSTTSS